MAVDRVEVTKSAQAHVSEVIDRLRRYWRLSQEEMALAIGMNNQQQLGERLNCKRHWNEEQLAAVATYFKIEPGDLYGPAEAAVVKSAAAGGPINAGELSSSMEGQLLAVTAA